MLIGAAVREARKSVGLTQDELGQRAGLSRRAVVLLESGGGRVSTFNAVVPVLALRLTGLPSAPSIGEQVFRSRQQRGLSQVQLAAAANISVPTLSSLERGGGSVSALSSVLKILAPTARRRRPARASWNQAGDTRFTPPEWIAALESALGKINLDPCWHPKSYVRPETSIDEAANGLVTRWSGKFAFVNPPYSNLSTWIQRCALAWDGREVTKMAALLPIRFETAAFQDLIVGTADLIVIRNKPRFHDFQGRRMSIAPFGAYFALWGCTKLEVRDLAKSIGGRIFWADGAE